ncbi:MAG: 30S ribosomal protein S16 [Cytophagales bacterium]
MVRLRFVRQGKKKRVHHGIVVANAKSPRDGRFIEKVGYTDPHTNDTNINIERAVYWLQQGAQPTTSVRLLLSKKGIMLGLHLMEGIRKGKRTKAGALQHYANWEKEVAKRKNPKVNFVGKVSMRDLLEALPDNTPSNLATATKPAPLSNKNQNAPQK